jgi:hypothetical protein
LKVDASEFEGNVRTLSENLERKLQRKIEVHHRTLQIDDDLSHSKIRDALKHVLHKLEPQRYRVVTESGSIRIRKMEPHPHKVRQKEGTSPSAPQTLPYFFPR